MQKGKLLSHVRKYFSFEKHDGRTEIYLVMNPNSDSKVFLPVKDSVPLNPVVIDNTNHCYTLFADQIFYLKSFDFILSLSCSDTNIFYCKLALPTEYIMNSFTDEEKENFYRILQNANNKRYEFFQVAQIYA
jgi:hypothetical protein